MVRWLPIKGAESRGWLKRLPKVRLFKSFGIFLRPSPSDAKSMAFEALGQKQTSQTAHLTSKSFKFKLIPPKRNIAVAGVLPCWNELGVSPVDCGQLTGWRRCGSHPRGCRWAQKLVDGLIDIHSAYRLYIGAS